MLYTQSGWLVSYNTDTLVYIIIQSILWFLKSWTEAEKNIIKNKTLAYINQNIFLCAFFVAFIAVFFRFLIFVFFFAIYCCPYNKAICNLFIFSLAQNALKNGFKFIIRETKMAFILLNVSFTCDSMTLFSLSKYINIAKIIFDITLMHAVVYVLFSKFFDWKMYFSSLV